MRRSWLRRNRHDRPSASPPLWETIRRGFLVLQFPLIFLVKFQSGGPWTKNAEVAGPKRIAQPWAVLDS